MRRKKDSRWLEEFLERKAERVRESHSKKAETRQNIIIVVSIIIFIALILLGRMW